MKILFYRYGSICEPDIIEAMKHLGHEVFSINLEITDKNIPAQTVIKHVSDALLESSFDGVFSINFYPVVALRTKRKIFSYKIQKPLLKRNLKKDA